MTGSGPDSGDPTADDRGADASGADGSRPISVAELLARNGTLGAPPVGGRRRRRRGNSAAITVAELTGEIPVIRDEDPPPPADAEPESAYVAESADVGVTAVEHDEGVETGDVVETGYVVETGDVVDDDEDAEADDGLENADSAMVVVYSSADEGADDDGDDEVAEHDEAGSDEPVAEEPVAEEPVADEPVADEPDASPPRSADPQPRRATGPELAHDPRPVRRGLGAEEMAPDPVDQSVDLAGLVAGQDGDVEELRSYLRSSGGALFGGQSIADDLARRGLGVEADVGGLSPAADAAMPALRPSGGSLGAARQAAIALGQSALAVVFGAGLFIAFDQLWRWNNLVALVLSVLVILGLVVAVRVVRKTEDIASTLIAVAVGALVTLGPLALLQST